MDRLARYNFRDDHGHPLENCVEYRAIFSDHAAVVARLTEERDELNEYFTDLVNSLCASAGRILGDDCYIESPVEHVVNIEDKFREAEAERDAAIAKAKRAEEALRDIKIVARTPEEADSPDKAFDLILRIADEVLSSPPADATKMGSERERRLMELVIAAYREGFCTGEDSTIGDPDEYWPRSETKATLATLSPQRGGQKGEE